MHIVTRLGFGAVLFGLLLAGASAAAQSVADGYTPVTEAMLLDPPPEDWPMWRRTYGHWGHSPLDQIDTTNVGSLRLAWAWTMGEGRQETTPLVHGGMMFLVQPCDFVEALDVRDGLARVGVPPGAGRPRRQPRLRQPQRRPLRRQACSSPPTTPTSSPERPHRRGRVGRGGGRLGPSASTTPAAP